MDSLTKDESIELLKVFNAKTNTFRKMYSISQKSYMIFEADEEAKISVDDMNEFTVSFIVPPEKNTAFKKAIQDTIDQLVTKELIVDPAPVETDNTIEYSFLSSKPEVTVKSLEKTFKAIDDALIVEVFGELKGENTDSIGKVVTVDSGENKGKIAQIVEKIPDTDTYKVKLEDGNQEIELNMGDFTIHDLDLLMN